MTEAQTLALVLAGLYLLEQTLRVLPDALVFRRKAGGGWTAVRARPWSAFADRALVLAPLVPPLRGVVVVAPWPLSLSPEGILAWPADGRPGPRARAVPVRWEEIRDTDADGAALLVNGAHFVDAGSAPAADALANLVAGLAGAPPADREARIAEALDATLDADVARARVAAWEEHRALLSLASHAVFALVAAAVLFMAWEATHPVVWLSLLALALPAHLLGVWAFARAHRALHPARVRERRVSAALLAVAPLESAHADTFLSRDLFPLAHGAAVAAALGEDAVRRETAAGAYRRLRHPTADERPDKPEGARVWEWHRAMVAAAIAARHADALAPLLTARGEPDARGRCPRCLALHARAAGDCGDCAGVALRPLT